MALAPEEIPLRVGFADTAAEILCRDAKLNARLQQAFQHCPTDNPPDIGYVIDHSQPLLWETRRNGELIRQDLQEIDVLEGLMHDLVAQLITHTRRQAVFHAAGVAQNGRSALLVAESGSGKSTLTGWLVSCGLNYLTDEIIAWDAESRAVSGLARPLLLKRGATALWQGWLTAAGTLQQARPFGNATLWLDPELIRPGSICHQATPAVLIFPHYQPGANFQATPLSPAWAVFMLLQHLVNGPNLPGDGLELVRRLGQSLPAWEVAYGSFSDSLGEWVERELKLN